VKRREFITLLGGAAAVWPVGVRAQDQSEPFRRVGVLMAYWENDAEAQKYVSVVSGCA
jgi:putative tryptophan/tyrosine transport system substrate-binding protein